jgi:hypothetical protein
MEFVTSFVVVVASEKKKDGRKTMSVIEYKCFYA